MANNRTVFTVYEKEDEWITMIDSDGTVILFNPATGEKR